MPGDMTAATMRRVLAAVDFSAPSGTALAFASRLAAQGGAELHVVHVQDPLLVAAAQTRGLDLTQETTEALGDFVRSVAGDGHPARVHVVTGTASATVCDVAACQRADLIVIGAHGMSGAEHVIFGSVAEGIVRRAATSVLVVPATWTPPDANRPDLLGTGPVVAATDLSVTSVQAAAAACDLAALLGTSLELVHVIPELSVLDRWKSHADDALAARKPVVEQRLRTLARALHATVPVATRIEQGHLAERLATVVAPAEDRRPILVVGRRSGHTHDGAPGSTAYRVLMLAQVPVLVHLPSPSM